MKPDASADGRRRDPGRRVAVGLARVAVAGWLFLGVWLPTVRGADAEPVPRIVPVHVHDLKSLWSDGAWRGLSLASDGQLYIGLCTHDPTRHAVVMRFDPQNGEVAPLADIGRIMRPEPAGAMSHGKIHTPFLEHDGRLYFATHFGPVSKQTHEAMPYPGGALLAFDMAGGRFSVVGRAPAGEGIITLAADFARNTVYAVVLPSGKLLAFDVTDGAVSDFGETDTAMIEARNAIPYVDAVRALAVDPATGRVYGSRTNGSIWCMDREVGRIVDTGMNVQSGIVGEASAAARERSTWRMIVYDLDAGCFYGTHRGTGSLFRFDPAAGTVTPLVRLVADADVAKDAATEASRLGVVLLDGVIYHVAHGPPVDLAPERARHPRHQAHLITYDTRTGIRRDHGALVAPGGRRVVHNDALEVLPDGRLFALAFVELTDPVHAWQLLTWGRGTGANRTVANVYFELSLVEIPPVVTGGAGK